MVLIQCDRCSDTVKTGTRVRVLYDSSQYSNIEIEVDLCDRCKRALKDFFKPLPQETKGE